MSATLVYLPYTPLRLFTPAILHLDYRRSISYLHIPHHFQHLAPIDSSKLALASDAIEMSSSPQAQGPLIQPLALQLSIQPPPPPPSSNLSFSVATPLENDPNAQALVSNSNPTPSHSGGSQSQQQQAQLQQGQSREKDKSHPTYRSDLYMRRSTQREMIFYTPKTGANQNTPGQYNGQLDDSSSVHSNSLSIYSASNTNGTAQNPPPPPPPAMSLGHSSNHFSPQHPPSSTSPPTPHPVNYLVNQPTDFQLSSSYSNNTPCLSAHSSTSAPLNFHPDFTTFDYHNPNIADISLQTAAAAATQYLPNPNSQSDIPRRAQSSILPNDANAVSSHLHHQNLQLQTSFAPFSRTQPQLVQVTSPLSPNHHYNQSLQNHPQHLSSSSLSSHNSRQIASYSSHSSQIPTKAKDTAFVVTTAHHNQKIHDVLSAGNKDTSLVLFQQQQRLLHQSHQQQSVQQSPAGSQFTPSMISPISTSLDQSVSSSRPRDSQSAQLSCPDFNDPTPRAFSHSKTSHPNSLPNASSPDNISHPVHATMELNADFFRNQQNHPPQQYPDPATLPQEWKDFLVSQLLPTQPTQPEAQNYLLSALSARSPSSKPLAPNNQQQQQQQQQQHSFQHPQSLTDGYDDHNNPPIERMISHSGHSTTSLPDLNTDSFPRSPSELTHNSPTQVQQSHSQGDHHFNNATIDASTHFHHTNRNNSSPHPKDGNQVISLHDLSHPSSNHDSTAHSTVDMLIFPTPTHQTRQHHAFPPTIPTNLAQNDDQFTKSQNIHNYTETAPIDPPTVSPVPHHGTIILPLSTLTTRLTNNESTPNTAQFHHSSHTIPYPPMASTSQTSHLSRQTSTSTINPLPIISSPPSTILPSASAMTLPRTSNSANHYADREDPELRAQQLQQQFTTISEPQIYPGSSKLYFGQPPSGVLIIKKPGEGPQVQALRDIADFLTQRGVKVFVEQVVQAAPEFSDLYAIDTSDPGSGIDFGITLGGDGTVLHYNDIFNSNDNIIPPVVCFSMGTLGFLAPFPISSYREVLTTTLSAHQQYVYCCTRTRLQCNIFRKGQFKANYANKLQDETNVHLRHMSRQRSEVNLCSEPCKTLPTSLSTHSESPLFSDKEHGDSIERATIATTVQSNAASMNNTIVNNDGETVPASSTNQLPSTDANSTLSNHPHRDANSTPNLPPLPPPKLNYNNQLTSSTIARRMTRFGNQSNGVPSPSPSKTHSPTNNHDATAQNSTTPLTKPSTQSFYPLNEVVLQRALSSMASIQLFVDGHYVTTISADGIIIATPTGSSGYCMAAGGPMVAPSTPALIITPICPHNLSFRPVVVCDGTLIRLRVDRTMDPNTPLVASFDGRNHLEMFPGDSIQVRVSKIQVPTIVFSEFNTDWFESIKYKLYWNARPEEFTSRKGTF